MGTNCAPLVADLFLLCYERGFMMSLSGDKQADIIEALNTTSRYVGFDNLVRKKDPAELQLNKANTSNTDASFFGLAFLTILFLPNFMINVTMLILKLSISFF